MSGLAEPIGEVWMTANESRIATGPFAGRTLSEAWPAMPPEWAGATPKRDRTFPLLVKFIFAEEKLSVQVHPDDEYAAKHEPEAGGRGKTEMWYALRARAGAQVMVGLKPEATRDVFQQAIADGTAEECLEHVPVREGEAIFVPAGTAHTIGPGLVLCEIQQHSDLTYRVYDYNRRDAQGRRRPLHIEKALAVMRFGQQKGGKIDPVRGTSGAVTKTFFAACRYFVTEKWEFAESAAAESSREHFDLLVVLDGRGEICFRDERTEYGPAQVWMIPAGLGKFEITPKSRTSLLRTYVPTNLDACARELAAAGAREAEIARLVHA
jgi:mannose-6-phosphate isomerase